MQRDQLISQSNLDDIGRQDLLGPYEEATSPIEECQIHGESTQEFLAGKNDGGETFLEIADWIEQNL